MNIRNVWSVTTAAVLTVGMAAFAQTSQPSPTATDRDTPSTQSSSPGDTPSQQGSIQAPSPEPRTVAQGNAQSGSPISLVGCIQREADYRKANDAGRGGAAATGLGLGNEYVLVNAMPAAGATGSQGVADCSAATGGSAYELSGSKEGELAQFVGRRVELVGMMKNSDTAVGTSGSGGAAVGTAGSGTATSGGFDPLGQDLRLPEVDVTSIREAAAIPPAATRPAVSDQAAPQATPAPEPRSATPEPQPQATSPAPAEPASTGTSGSQNELPRTASPLALAGLTGLLSLAGAMGIRRYRRRS
jgi:hypothetical protein